MASEPITLSFDTSAAHCAAALLSGDRMIASRTEEMGRGQAERLMPMLEEMLADAGLGWSDIGLIGVGTGPGNFTGIRISVAAARGLALGLGIRAVGVSSLEAQAFGTAGVVVSTVTAPRGDLYLQVIGGGETTEPRLVSPDDLPPLPARAEPTCIGTAAEEIAARCAGRAAAPAYPLAEAIARIAIARQSGSPQRPAPLYIRPVDASPSREAPPRILL